MEVLIPTDRYVANITVVIGSFIYMKRWGRHFSPVDIQNGSVTLAVCAKDLRSICQVYLNAGYSLK